MKQLEERKALAQRGSGSSSASSSQTLTGDNTVASAEVGSALEQRALTSNTGMQHDFLPLTVKFSAVNEEHFKSIAENKFRPENISKLSNDHTAIKPDRKYIRMGDIDLQTRDDDASASDTKGMVQLAACFTIYMQILVHFANPAIRMPLHEAMLFYINRLMRHSFVRTWESVRGFHFAFHRTCIADGIKDPQIWKRVDANLEAQCLVIKPAYPGPASASTSGGASGNRAGPHPAANRNPNPALSGESPVCFKFNGRGCTLENCKFRHICRACGGPHGAWGCGNANITPIGKRE